MGSAGRAVCSSRPCRHMQTKPEPLSPAHPLATESQSPERKASPKLKESPKVVSRASKASRSLSWHKRNYPISCRWHAAGGLAGNNEKSIHARCRSAERSPTPERRAEPFRADIGFNPAGSCANERLPTHRSVSSLALTNSLGPSSGLNGFRWKQQVQNVSRMAARSSARPHCVCSRSEQRWCRHTLEGAPRSGTALTKTEEGARNPGSRWQENPVQDLLPCSPYLGEPRNENLPLANAACNERNDEGVCTDGCGKRTVSTTPGTVILAPTASRPARSRGP